MCRQRPESDLSAANRLNIEGTQEYSILCEIEQIQGLHSRGQSRWSSSSLYSKHYVTVLLQRCICPVSIQFSLISMKHATSSASPGICSPTVYRQKMYATEKQIAPISVMRWTVQVGSNLARTHLTVSAAILYGPRHFGFFCFNIAFNMFNGELDCSDLMIWTVQTLPIFHLSGVCFSRYFKWSAPFWILLLKLLNSTQEDLIRRKLLLGENEY